jgi:hypothetical protein
MNKKGQNFAGIGELAMFIMVVTVALTSGILYLLVFGGWIGLLILGALYVAIVQRHIRKRLPKWRRETKRMLKRKKELLARRDSNPVRYAGGYLTEGVANKKLREFFVHLYEGYAIDAVMVLVYFSGPVYVIFFSGSPWLLGLSWIIFNVIVFKAMDHDYIDFWD